jgi:pyruvate dehydrogenase E2 component (dihydrolipoamide acetyltransferase)
LAKDVVMPALGMAQETGTLIQWFKTAGESIAKGEPLMEVETDKTTVEIEAPASGVLANVTAQPGDMIPVGQVIAVILAEGEVAPSVTSAPQTIPVAEPPKTPVTPLSVTATPVAQRIASEHNLDLSQVKPQGGRVQKEDVLAFLAVQSNSMPVTTIANGRTLASPKARRLADERGVELSAIRGSGPEGAVLAADVLVAEIVSDIEKSGEITLIMPEQTPISRIWRVMAERISQAWATIPHFYLLREVNASKLIAWLGEARERATEKITVTDLLVKVVADALRQHPRLNASWLKDTIMLNGQINIGLAVAVEDGLVVPVIHQADTLGLSQLAARRSEFVSRANAGKLSPDDLSGGTFTISNLGMYGVDAFNAIVNPPQAAILAVGRIADRVVPLNGQLAIQPMMTLSLSCDHRVVDGARGAQFLQTLASSIEDPMRLLD